MSQTQSDPDLEKWASYHGLEPIAYGESKETWPQRNTALHVGDLAATPKVGTLADRDESAPDGALYRAVDAGGELSEYNADTGSWITLTGGGTPTTIGSTSPMVQNQRRQWSWSSINWEDKGGPIEDGSASGTTTVDGASYPTVIDAQAFFDNPLDNYYMFWSGHDTPVGIHLSTAPELWGPWTFEQEVIAGGSLGGNHVASPCAVIDPENDRLNLYVHTNDNGQRDYLMTAPRGSDGTSFASQGVVIDAPFDDTWDEQERSYFQVRRVDSTWHAVYQGRDRQNNAPAIGIAHSHNGEDWVAEPSPAFDATNYLSHDPRGFGGGSPSLSTIGGTLSIHWNDRANADSRVLPFDARDKAFVQGGETVYTLPDWAPASANAVGAYDFRTDDEYLYLFYIVTDSSLLQIGVARASLGEIA